jgi:acyl phosphate:glycerol-3-phosphate acyltransferase
MNYLLLLLSYLTGSISFAIIVSKFMKIDDPRNYGSKNPGATNVMRSGNKKAAAITLLGDFLKGFVVVLAAKSILGSDIRFQSIIALCGLLVVLGHIYPVFFNFKGGKGVATSLGVMAGINILLALVLLLTWIIVFKLSKVSSLSALIATLLSPLYAYLLMGNNSYFGAVVIIAFFVLYKHKSNILRLFDGQEHKF